VAKGRLPVGPGVEWHGSPWSAEGVLAEVARS
jgi:hypothetical protein